MASFEVFCPSCNGALYVESEDEGKVAACPHCGVDFTVPPPPAAAPIAPAQPTRPAQRPPRRPTGHRPAERRPAERRPAARRGAERRPPDRRSAAGRRTGGRPARQPEPRGHRRSSGPSPAVLGGGAVLLVLIGAGLFFAVKGGGFAKPAVKTSFGVVHAGRVESGRGVEFQGALYPWNLLEAQPTGEKVRHYAILMSRKGPFFKRVKEAAAAVDTWLATEIPIFEKAFRNGYGYGRATKDFDELEDLVEDAVQFKRGDKVIGIRLKDFGPVADQIQWEKIQTSFTSDFKPTSIDFESLLAGMRDNKPISFDSASQEWTLVDLQTRIERLSAERPPNMGKELPDLGRGYTGPEDEELADRVTELYNQEVLRRQDYVLQSMEERLLELRTGLRQLLALKNRRVNGTIEPYDYQLQRLFTAGGLPSPEVIVREETAPADTFASTEFKTTAFIVTSYPPGADVMKNGSHVGTTPLVVGSIPIGDALRFEFRLAGHGGVSQSATAVLTPDGFIHVEAVLRPE